jgi:hypothetical protein
MISPAGAGHRVAPCAQGGGRRVELLQEHFFNRTDRVAHLAAWGDPCPAQGGEDLPALLQGHVAGEKVEVRWGPTKRGKSGRRTGRFRIGSYSPAPDGTVRVGCVDCDGGGRHSAPLADPLGAALAILTGAERLVLPAYLERSGGGAGWHVWLFFREPVPAGKVRRLLLALCPAGLPLKEGGTADPARNKGLECFPKQDALAEDGTGNMVWLPWWHGAAERAKQSHQANPEGANQFHQANPEGELSPYLPDGFDAATADELALALRQIPPKPSANGRRRAPRLKMRATNTEWDGERVSTKTLLDRAARRARAGGGGGEGRNDSGFWLALQLRDNGYRIDEARPVMDDYVGRVGRTGDHEYAGEEAGASLESAYSGRKREPWSKVRHEGANGTAQREEGDASGDSKNEPPEDGPPPREEADAGGAARPPGGDRTSPPRRRRTTSRAPTTRTAWPASSSTSTATREGGPTSTTASSTADGRGRRTGRWATRTSAPRSASP